MTELTQGANVALNAAQVSVSMTWPTGAGSLDGSAYLLTASGKVRMDSDMVFYNQPSGADGAVTVASHNAGHITFGVDFSKMPAVIERIVFCLTVDAGQAAKTMSAFTGAGLSASAVNGVVLGAFRPELGSATEAAMMMAELYLRNGQWKLRAVGQGFNGGLAPLARSFGIDVSDAEAAPPPQPNPAPSLSPSPAPPVTPPSAPINLSKITLDKAKPTISLQKTGETFGELSINLNWSAAKQGGGGLFGGRPKSIDLDLGCLYELQDGFKGIVQALGDTFGDLNNEPYIALSGDDRTGAVSAGETLRVNGRKWSEIKRIALFAYIYEGVPNWQATDGVVTITMPGQPPIEIRMTEGQNGRGFCGLAVIENAGGTMKFTRLIEYFNGHQDFDRRVGWGMRWQAGSKN
ncbi:TerD family protein [Brevundimonas diminuta]|uniref:TerD family protein n=1 Tax=Brevundimonas diminuta TaxID=293 RepID=UPI001F58C4CE|nr:TerD family protein [Brevundimonas diminuta]